MINTRAPDGANKSCKFKRDKVSPKHKLHHTCRTNHIPQCAPATRAARCSYTGKLDKARVVRVLYPGCWVPGCFTLGAPTPTPSKAPTCTQNGSHLILLSKCALRLSPHACHPISAGMLACWYYHPITGYNWDKTHLLHSCSNVNPTVDPSFLLPMVKDQDQGSSLPLLQTNQSTPLAPNDIGSNQWNPTEQSLGDAGCKKPLMAWFHQDGQDGPQCTELALGVGAPRNPPHLLGSVQEFLHRLAI